MTWNDELEKKCAELWKEGLSASMVAAELGHGITRSAVIGKINRMGLSGTERKDRTRVNVSGPALLKGPKKAPKPERRVPAAPRLLKAPVEMPKRVEELFTPPQGEPVTIMDLRDGVCRWPYGDPQDEAFRYCGTRCDVTDVYCGYHQRIAYVPSQPKARPKSRVLVQAASMRF